MTTNYQNIARELWANPATRDELARCTDVNEAVVVAARLAKLHGHDVSPEELLKALAPPHGELSDTELETVVGGKGSPHQEIKGDGSLWAQFACLVGNHTSSAYNDEIDGGDGNDTIWGGYGDDTLYGGSGNDSMDGGYGYADTVDGGDYMDGGTGNDTMWGGLGEDEMYGGADNDDMDGGEDNDSVYGGDGNDTVDGGEGDDLLHGDAGNDVVSGGAGNDELYGDDGNDTLRGGTGNDTLTGGAGSDVFVLNKDGGADTITDFDPDHDKFRFNDGWKSGLIDVAAAGGKTFITYGDSTITLEGVEMTYEEVMARKT